MADLKPCPFCGGEPTIRIYRGKNGWRDRYAVICRYDEGGCGAESGLFHYESEAIESWNTRHSGWIPIKKKIPRGGEHVLVTLHWEEDDWYEVCEMDYGVLKYEEDKILERVTAWMEMPEPYKDKGDEND